MRRYRGVRRSKTGFTLIELLVVIAIIGVLVALIMPAVQAARESANRAKCQNNLKQLGLAAQEYHDNFNSFPAGWYCTAPVTDTNGNLVGDQNCVNYASSTNYWNGMTGLFLKLEMGNLYNEINFNLYPYDTSNWTAIRRTVDGFVCPSNRKAASVAGTTNQTPPGQTNTTTPPKAGPTDYRANMAAGMYLPPGPSGNCTTQNPANIACLIFDNGVMFQNSAVSFADVTDGTTNTVLIGESLTGTWPDGTSCCVRTNVDRTVNRPIVTATGNSYTYWMSKHPNQVNFVKCDGSVATVTNQIQKLVLNKMMTRNGGESLSSDEIK